MTAMDFLIRLRSHKIRVWAEGDELVFRAPRDALTPALRAELAERKEELLSLLHNLSYSQAPLLPASRGRDLPLSFGQERLWLLDQLEPGSAVYNTVEAFRLLGPLNVAALKQSLCEIVRRHEILRTTFPAVDGQPIQRICPDMPLELPIVDLRDLPEDEREAKALHLIGQDVQLPFDLAMGPLLRSKLLRLGVEDHVFFLTMHHIISDGWSTDWVMFPELEALYAALITEGSPLLPELPIQYADYAIWQRLWLQTGVLEEQLDYWTRQLDGIPGDLDLPVDHPEQSDPTRYGREQSLTLSKDLAEALHALGQKAGATLFMTLLAAFQVQLQRYSGQDDIVVATPVAGRNRPETEILIGFFVNTLVLRTDLSGDPGFWELLERVRQVCLGAFEHQDLPFERLVEAVRPDRIPGRNPLFRVMFQLLGHEPEVLALSGLHTARLNIECGMAMFDLSLDILQEAGQLRCVVNYSVDLFEDSTIERMLGHFQTLLEGIVADPQQPISNIPLLTETEKDRILVSWNQTQAQHIPGLCAHELFEIQAEQTPEAPALVFGDQVLSYSELGQRANQLAHRLAHMGVGPEVCVGICMERSFDLVIAILGVLKAGGAYVPVDPTYPGERLRLLLEDAAITLLLTSGAALASPPAPSVELIHLDTDWKSIATESKQPLPIPAHPDNLAYVIYTSGSTGQPKGVQITHRSLVNHTLAVCAQLGRGPGERLLQVASTSFDSTADEVFTCLLSGAALVLPADEVLTSPDRILQICLDQQITALDPPTAVWHALVDAMDEVGMDFPPTIRLVYFGGERALPERLASWHARVGDRVQLLNGYGPTETTIVSTIFVLVNIAELIAKAQEVPIGRPISNTQAYILDEYLAPVPIGVPGELCIAGAGVARGYLNQPALTAECFVPCPFSREPGSRMYRTGDLARYLPDGNIEYLGRRDQQVKLRGFRVEPGEIESVLMQHEGVREAAVVPHQDPMGGSSARLVAYVVLRSSQTPSVGDLRQFLRDRLPDYMVPSAILVLGSLPRTPTGKIDRRALPQPEWSRELLGQEYVAPRTPDEEALAEIWSQVLGVESPGVFDSFFDLGGHSLLATQVISRARAALELELAVRSLFETPTIAGLAQAIMERRKEGSLDNMPAISARPRTAKTVQVLSSDELVIREDVDENA